MSRGGSHQLRSAPGPLARSWLALLVAGTLALLPAAAADRSAVARSQRFHELHGATGAGDTRPLVLFDNTHGETAGNADWVLDGGYSDWADDLARHGYRVEELGQGPITATALARCRVFVLPEPNEPLEAGEREALIAFVEDGGGLYLIADHSDSDRNGDGWDSVRILNELVPPFGFAFDEAWFNEDPMKGPILPSEVTSGVRSMGSWGGTSIRIVDPDRARGHIFVSPANGGNPFLVTATHGAGRVVALGDSSPYDDGTGDPRDRLHDGYNRLMFDMAQMGLNTVDWLCGEPPRKLERRNAPGVRWWPDPEGPAAGPVAVIDLGHGNHDADHLEIFRSQLESLGVGVHYARAELTGELLAGVDLLVLADPASELSSGELEAIRDHVDRGAGLLMTCRSDYQDAGNPAHANMLLEAMGSGWRFNDDQVVDDRQNSGREYNLLVRPASGGWIPAHVEQVLYLSGCSLYRAGGSAGSDGRSQVLLAGSPTARNRDQDGAGDARPGRGPELALVVAETRSAGRIVLTGASLVSDASYATRLRGQGPLDNHTRGFNRAICRWLIPSAGSAPGEDPGP